MHGSADFALGVDFGCEIRGRLVSDPMRLGAVRVVVAASLCAVLAGCSLPNPFDSSTAATSTTPLPVPTGQEALARFYGQQLAWSECGEAECAALLVPLDYAKPDGSTLSLSVLKMAARGGGSRIGSLVVNPGGPGGSGVEYAKYAQYIVDTAVYRRFDVVGFDPRGVGSSEPIDCLTDTELDAFLGQDPTPDDRAEAEEAARIATDFGAKCVQRSGERLGHVSTIEAAKDMDILRAALGDEHLFYLGKSYGTYLGATYAGLFPTRVGRMVLDGVLAPDLSAEEISIGQAVGFDTATKAWAADCVAEGDCPLGASVDAVMTSMGELFTRLDATPAPVTGDPRVTALTEGWAAYGVAGAMYDQGMWGSLTEALRALISDNDGTELMGMANRYAERSGTGTYEGNLMEVIYAVNCLDTPDSPDLATYEERAKKAAAAAPLNGRFLAWSGVVCGNWPVKATHQPGTIAATGAPPIVVIGTTRDPATPYEWAVRLVDQLDSGVLITFDGDGHTAYTRSNDCVDKAVDTYYLTGKAPAADLRC